MPAQLCDTVLDVAGVGRNDRPDLLVRDQTHRIVIYLHTGDRRKLYRGAPDIVLGDLPMFGGLDTNDLNGDGADDLILSAARQPFSPAPLRADVIAVYVSQRR